VYEAAVEMHKNARQSFELIHGERNRSFAKKSQLRYTGIKTLHTKHY
jgi:hypothetical protein